MSLDTRARDAVDQTKAQLGDLNIPEPGSWLRRVRRRQGAERGVAGLLVVALLVGASVLWAGMRDDSGTEVVTPAFDAGGWTRIDGATAGFGAPGDFVGPLWDIVAGGPGFVAVGSRFGPGPGVWTSPDGRSWQQVDVGGLPSDEMSLCCVAAGPSGLVAIGLVAIGLPDEGDPIVLRSDDGLAWQEIARGPTVFPGRAYLVSGEEIQVVAGGPGFLAYGDTDDGEAAIWTSPDGAEWTRVLDEPSPTWSLVDDVERTSDGFLALGREADPASGSMYSVAWLSPDGVAWNRTGERSGIETPMEGAVRVQTAAARGDLVLATAKTPREPPDSGDPDAPLKPGSSELWESRDGGRTWARVPEFSDAFPDADVTELLTLGDRWIAMGAIAPAGAAGWVSTDGRTWTPMPDTLGGFGSIFVGAANDRRAVFIGGAIGSSPVLYVWESDTKEDPPADEARPSR